MNFYRDKSDIKAWLDKHKIRNYSIVEDKIYGFVVDVDDHVLLMDKKLKTIPVKFGCVTGSFDCSKNQLERLDFAPHTARDFYCRCNYLISLKGCPSNVERDFDCSDNELLSLEFCPAKLQGVFQCSSNKFRTLEFCPVYVAKDFYCCTNIFSLEFIPEFVGRNLIMTYLPEDRFSIVIDGFDNLVRESKNFKETNTEYKTRSLAQKIEQSLDSKMNMKKVKI